MEVVVAEVEVVEEPLLAVEEVAVLQVCVCVRERESVCKGERFRECMCV